MIKAVTPEKKLTLPKLSKSTKTAYARWKKETLISIRQHPQFRPYVTSSLTTGIVISTTLPSDERGMLYMSLSKALENQVKADVGWDIINDPDGLAMMEQNEERQR